MLVAPSLVTSITRLVRLASALQHHLQDCAATVAPLSNPPAVKQQPAHPQGPSTAPSTSTCAWQHSCPQTPGWGWPLQHPLLLAVRGLSSSSSSARHDNSDAGAAAADASTPGGARGRDMAIVFTCAKCDTRAVKAFSRQSYEKGVVLVKCPGCQAMHLIADHLGWFGDEGFKVDDFLEAMGQPVKRVSLDPTAAAAAAAAATPQLTAEDLAGYSRVSQLLSLVLPDAPGGSSNSGAAAASDAGEAPACQSAADEDDGGVLQMAPGDVQAWGRVQQQQQQQHRRGVDAHSAAAPQDQQ